MRPPSVTVTTPAIIFCSGFHCDWECRQSLRPPLVRLRSGLWLPILRNSAQHLTMPHFPFSSSGSRPRWGDFNPQWDMFFLNLQCPVYLSFSFMLQGTPVNDPGLASLIKGHLRRWRSGGMMSVNGNGASEWMYVRPR